MLFCQTTIRRCGKQYAGGDGDPVRLWRNSWSDFGGDDDLSEGVERSGGVKRAAKMSQYSNDSFCVSEPQYAGTSCSSDHCLSHKAL